MVKSCCAVGCHNVFVKGNGIHWYKFPPEPETRARWISAIRREHWEPTQNTWICSEHFISGEKSSDPLSPDYVPSVFQHVSSPQKRKLGESLSRYERRKATKRKRSENSTQRVEPLGEANARTSSNVPSVNSQVMTAASIRTGHGKKANSGITLQSHFEQATKSKECWELKERVKKLEKQVEDLTTQNKILQTVIDDYKSRTGITEAVLKNDDKRVKYYTGLPSYEVLKIIFDFVSKGLPDCFSGGKKTPFEQFFIALMKLRLNLGDQDLSYRFGVCQSTISRYFSRWMDVLYTKLSYLIQWPERGELIKTMPTEFRKHFQKCVVIIDCFEIFIERPTSLPARAQTWSNYKHLNTVKYLIGITPQGSIAFISQGWGGRTSDVHITENSGLLSKLLPGDVVLADRGFIIQESIGLYCAEVKLPPFTRGKKQLTKVEVDAARRLSRVRIHVERVIGMVRQKYTILQSTLPICMLTCDDTEQLSTIDKILTICCALCNYCDSVVSPD
ncbi:uncharacterized protein [Dysidea avara]|uniref:uncharacterized protein n=1 Tax=Dysidea avara TaxID=196820 RepID=UPI003331CB65